MVLCFMKLHMHTILHLKHEIIMVTHMVKIGHILKESQMLLESEQAIILINNQILETNIGI